MKKILLTTAIALLAAGSLFAQMPTDSLLRRYAAGMLMVGFKGDSVTEDCDAARYVRCKPGPTIPCSSPPTRKAAE